MKNKGFTLVELLGVLVVLGLISLITIPSVTGILKNNKEKAYNKQINTIINAAKTWSIKNANEIKKDQDNYVMVSTLLESGYIEQDELINPIDNSKINGCVKIKYTEIYKQYEYEYNKEC